MSFFEAIESLKKLSHRDALREWLVIQDYTTGDLKLRALLSYVDDWLHLTLASPKFNFDHFLSEDLSSILYGKCPVIFMGTNDWAIKRFLMQEQRNTALNKWRSQLEKIIPRVSVPIFCCIVPEKDTLLRHFSKFDNDSMLLAHSIDQLMLEYNDYIAGFSYLQSITNVPDKRIQNYEYYDSHLLSRDYLSIFYSIIQGLGLINEIDSERIILTTDVHVGDLARKLHASSITAHYLALTYIDAGAKLVSGDKTFNSPLRQTRQSFKCTNASIKAKVAIYGDSHSSIYDQKKLTYLLANTFEECDFYWDPFCVNNKRPVRDADFVVFEVSHRFMT
ncbi:MAG: hypothetical protein L3J75_16480 [Methylococcaceae bacterium]|nr:hypothetical protein [Methylococcaceae bacterium]